MTLLQQMICRLFDTHGMCQLHLENHPQVCFPNWIKDELSPLQISTSMAQYLPFGIQWYCYSSCMVGLEKREVKRSARDGSGLSQASQVPVFFKRPKCLSKQDFSKLPPHCVQCFLPVSSCWHKIVKWYPISVSPLFLRPQCWQMVWRTTDNM